MQRFASTPEGHAEFDAWLRKHPLSPVYILVDTRHEEYRMDTVPHVTGRDRQLLLEHKGKRLFANAPYTYAQVLGRASKQPKKRSEDNALFMGINEAELFDNWLEPLLKQKVPIRGICSLPLLSQILLKQFPPVRYTLIVTHTKQIDSYSPHGLRQSFFLGEQFQLNRLIPLNSLEPLEYAEYVFQEVINTQRYLNARSLLPYGKALTVLLLSTKTLLATFQNYNTAHGVPELDCQLMDLTELAQWLGIRQISTEPCLSELLAWQMIKNGTQNHYAHKEEQQYFIFLQLRRRLLAGSLGFALVAAAAGGVNLYSGMDLDRQAQQHAAATEKTNAKYNSVQQKQQKLLGVSIDVNHIKDTVDVANYLLEYRTFPHNSLKAIAGVLAHFPEELKLKEIEWNVMDMPKKKSDVKGLGRLGLMMAKRMAKKKKKELLEVVKIQGEVQKFAGSDVDDLQEIVENFVHRLKKLPRVLSVKISSSPRNVDPNAALSGEVGGEGATPAETQFSVEVHIKYERTKI